MFRARNFRQRQAWNGNPALFALDILTFPTEIQVRIFENRPVGIQLLSDMAALNDHSFKIINSIDT